MNIKDMKISELKATAYDIMVSIQKLQNDLVTINQVINQKNNVVETVKKEEVPEKEEKKD